jgi:hypothetical protein
MCSINHELKAIYIHIPKNGGLYIEDILTKYYGFRTLYFTRNDHEEFTDSLNNFDPNKLLNGFIHIRKKGILRYFSTSKEHNEKTDAAWDAAKKKVSEGSKK